MTNAWCSDPSRDEAVRAAEDGRDRPLPTLEEAIAESFAAAAECSSTVSETGEPQSGLRTERITLEVTVDPRRIFFPGQWQNALRQSGSLMPGESVRVVEETSSDADAELLRRALAKSEIQRLKADAEVQRLRKELEAAAKLAPAANAAAESNHAAPAASGLEQQGVNSVSAGAQACESGQSSRLGAASGGGTLARIAEAFGCQPDDDDDLVEAARLLVRERDEAVAKAASGGGEKKPMKMPSREWFARMVDLDEANISVGGLASRVAELQAASGGGEAVAWMCEWTDHVGLHHTKTDAEDEANGDVVPQPLYRSPPQPRGWLTGEERKWIEYMKGNCVLPYAGMACMEAILARSTPPEVVLPMCIHERGHDFWRGWMSCEIAFGKALATAGVAVKEVPRG